MSVLLIDADEPLGQALACALREAGHHVITHSRTTHKSTDVHAPDLRAVLEALVVQHAPFNRVVFGLSSRSEQFNSLDDLLETQQELSRSLGEIHAVAHMMVRGEQGQIWVLLPEDSMHHYLDVPSQPVRNRALMAAVRSLAKELFRFGVRLNALQVQTLAEQIPSSAWRSARGSLKAYALMFKPLPCAEAARFIHGLLAQSHLPQAGLVVPLGVGFPGHLV